MLPKHQKDAFPKSYQLFDKTSLKSLRLRDLLTFGYLWLPFLALLSLTWPYRALLGLTGPYWALLGLTGPYWALLALLIN